MPGPGFLTVDLAPVWMVWRWPIIAYASFEIVVDLIALMRPGWVRIDGGASIARYLVGIGILSQIVQAGHWVVVDGLNLSPPTQSGLQINFDGGMQFGIGVAMAIMALQIVLEAWRLRRVHLAQVGLPHPA